MLHKYYKYPIRLYSHIIYDRMKRKEFIKKGAVAGLGVAALASSCKGRKIKSIDAPNIITNKHYQWKMVTTWGPNFPVVGEGCNRLVEWINTMSGGRMEIKVYGAGELVPALSVFEAVNDGMVEMGHGASYYWAGVEAAFQFFTSIPFGMNAQQMNAWLEFGGGQQLWDDLYDGFNIVPFAAGNTGVQMGGWYNKKIESMDSWKGLKMRMPGLGGKVIEKAGATAILSPGGELYTSLERGVIDATEWIGPYHDYLMRFYQIAKYYYYPGWHESGSVLECIANKEKYLELPRDLQEIIKTACYRSNLQMLAEFDAKNNIYLKKIKEESDVEVLPFPADVMSGMKRIALELYNNMAANDEWSRKVYSSFKSFKEDVSEWSKLSERTFYNDIM